MTATMTTRRKRTRLPGTCLVLLIGSFGWDEGMPLSGSTAHATLDFLPQRCRPPNGGRSLGRNVLVPMPRAGPCGSGSRLGVRYTTPELPSFCLGACEVVLATKKKKTEHICQLVLSFSLCASFEHEVRASFIVID
jgi:hypothetical protein